MDFLVGQSYRAEALILLLHDHALGAENTVRGKDCEDRDQPFTRSLLMINKSYGRMKEPSELFRKRLECCGDILRRMCELGESISRHHIDNNILAVKELLDRWDGYEEFFWDHMKPYEIQDFSCNLDHDSETKREFEDFSARLKVWNSDEGSGKGFMAHLHDEYVILRHCRDYIDELPRYIKDALDLMVALVSLKKSRVDEVCSSLETYLMNRDSVI